MVQVLVVKIETLPENSVPSTQVVWYSRGPVPGGFGISGFLGRLHSQAHNPHHINKSKPFKNMVWTGEMAQRVKALLSKHENPQV